MATTMVVPAGAASVSMPTRPSSSRWSATGISVPISLPTRLGLKARRAGVGSSGAVSMRPRATDPPAQARVNWATRSAPMRASRASWPFSNRRLASERRAKRWPVRRMLTGSNTADSMAISIVASVISLAAPPMTPAMPIGPLVSAMIKVSGVSSRSTWSRVSSRSPGSARRTTIVPSWTALPSKVWVGLPSSSMT